MKSWHTTVVCSEQSAVPLYDYVGEIININWNLYKNALGHDVRSFFFSTVYDAIMVV